MEVIEDLLDIIVPKVQKRIEDKGMSIEEALYMEFREIGYIPKDVFVQCVESRKDS